MTLRIYRLDIAYPEGSDEDGWEPEGKWWKHTRSGYPPHPDSDPYFTWPVEHNYLSKSGAEKRAQILREWGAAVTVVRSKPIEWDE